MIVEDAMPNLSAAEKVVKAESWSRLLQDIIPVLYLQDTLTHAFKIHTSNFPINHYDLKNAWAEIQEIERKKKAKEAEKLREVNAVEHCKERHQHIQREGLPDAGEIHPWNWFGSEVLVSPCFSCRPGAYKDWRKRMADKHPPTQAVHEVKKAVVLEFKKKEPVEIILSADEVADLLTEHNSLVRELTEDPKARLNLELVFDEGGNIFKLPHRADLTFSAAAMRQKIKTYRGILDTINAKENGQ